ncbi:MAG: efflux RND transporter permease subunit, partial [Bacteroidota bacterium]
EKNDVVKATIVRDETLYLKQRLALLTENGLMGFGIVLVLLACFLHWRLAFWVALSIPISFAGMFFCAMAVGATINIISLFAMILVIGILVDDGIVVSESIYQEYERGLNPTEAAIKGTLRVFPAVFGAILTTCIAFGGFYFISGRFGEFFGEMSTIVIFSLIFSLVEAAFILPAHISHSKALNRDKKKGRVLQFFEGIMNWIRDRVYTPALDFSLNNKGIIIASLVALFMATIGAIQGGIIQATFFPNIEFDNSIVTLELPSGTNERITDRWMDKIEESIYAVNEDLKKQYFDGEKDFVVKVTRNSGPKSNQGNIGIVFLDAESREDVVTVSDMNKMIRKKIGPIPDAETFTIGSVGAFGKPVSLTLVGDNLKELDTATEALKDSLRRLEELTDIGDDNQEGLREVNIKLNEKAHYLGLNLQEVVSQVRAGFFGTEIQRLQRGRDEVRVWVRYQREERNNVQQLKDMRIRFADGREFPLAEIADFEIERGVISIKHISGKRGITVDAELSTTDASAQAINANITGDILPQILERHPTVSFTQEGEARESAKSFESMGPVFTISFLIMFFVIALTFRSVGQTIAVAIIIPFGFIGVGFGHWLMGFQLSMSSYLGIFALIGVLVNDTLVFITTYNQLIASGKEQLEAVREAGISRFRPIVLTTLTTVAGLTPLLFEKSVQAQFLIPMAISVAFGLIVATVIILLLLPVLLMIMNRIRVYGLYVWEGEKLAPELVEPAVIGRKSNYLVWAVSALLLLGVFVAVVFLTIQLTGFLF